MDWMCWSTLFLCLSNSAKKVLGRGALPLRQQWQMESAGFSLVFPCITKSAAAGCTVLMFKTRWLWNSRRVNQSARVRVVCTEAIWSHLLSSYMGFGHRLSSWGEKHWNQYRTCAYKSPIKNILAFSFFKSFLSKQYGHLKTIFAPTHAAAAAVCFLFVISGWFSCGQKADAAAKNSEEWKLGANFTTAHSYSLTFQLSKNFISSNLVKIDI